MSFVEREGQMALLTKWIDEAAGGAGRVAVLSGLPGSGRSAMLREAARVAANGGVSVLTGAGSRAECDLPYGVMGQLIEQAAQGDPAEVCGEVLRAARLLDEDAASGPSPKLQRALVTALVRQAAPHTVLVCVDDAEYVDEESRRCLIMLARRLQWTRMVLLVSGSTLSGLGQSPLEIDLLRQSQCGAVAVSPLTPDAIREVLSGRSGAVDERTVSSAYRLTAGSPLLLTALADDQPVAEQPPDAPAEVQVGAGYCYAVLGTLYRLPPELVRMVRWGSVVGEPVTPWLGRLVGIPAAVVLRVKDTLAAAGILDDAGWFRHPAVAQVVLSEVDPHDLTEAHSRAAETLHADGAAAPAVADHLLAVGGVRQPWSVPVLVQAAEEVLASGAAPAAVEYLRLAAALAETREQTVEVVALLARAEWRIDPEVAVRHVDFLVDALRNGDLRGRFAFTPLRHLLWQGRIAEVLDILADLETSAAALDGETQEQLRSTQLWAKASYPPFGSHGDRDHPPVSQASLQTAPLVHVMTRRADGSSVDAAQQILQRGRLDDATVGPMVAALVGLMYAGRMDEADACCATLLKEADSREAPTWLALFCGIRSEIAVRRGDMVAVVGHAKAALAHLPARSWGVAVGRPLGSLVLALTSMGDYDKAADLLALPVPNAMFNTRFGLHYLYGRGHFYLATGRPSAALGNFTTCGGMMGDWDLDLPAVVPWRAGACEALLQLGDRRRARDIVEQQLALLTGTELRTRGMSLRLLAASSEPGARIPLLIEAQHALERYGDRLELAHVLADLHHELWARHDHERASVVGQRALKLAEEAQARPLQRRIRGQLDRPLPSEAPGPGPDGLDKLTEAERRVATLAAEGYPNREIARRLTITASTVEQHLTRVYRKLDIHRRWDLPDRLAHA